MIEVKLTLRDTWELGVFSHATEIIENRRMYMLHSAFRDQTTVPEHGVELEAEPAGEHDGDAQVVATITPEAVTRMAPEAAAPPSLDELTKAIQAYIGSSPVPEQVSKVQGLLAKYGAKKVGEVPEEKRAELMAELG